MPALWWRRASVAVALLLGLGAAADPAGHDATPARPPTAAPAPLPQGTVRLAASLTPEGAIVRNGLMWRVFAERSDGDGNHRLIAQSSDAVPSFVLPEGTYVAHVTFGYASAMRQVAISAGRTTTEKLSLNAGAIEVKGMLGEAPITPDKLSLRVYVPDHGNAEAKLVVASARLGQIIRLPEGMYHLVSTYLDTVGVGSLNPVSDTNSVISADLRVQAGKLVQATLTHRAAVLTLKLVNQPVGEALANTSFTILTQGGDIIRELIGAFPSLVLAEGDYLLIARHDGKTYQTDFKVQSALDRDIEVMAK